MSGNKYLSNDKGPLFSIEDDIDDDEFLRRRPGSEGNPSYSLFNNTSVPSYPPGNSIRNEQDTFEERRLQLLQQKKEIEERTVESTKRSLGLLRNSEEVGIATAEELLKQREQLERTDKRLDEINATLRFSHKHIQGIKSVFGSLKNYLSGKTDKGPPVSNYPDSDLDYNKRPLSETVASSTSSSRPNQQDHPALRLRGYNDSFQDTPTSSNHQQVIDQNLDEMITSISRLKGLAHGLGDEIESQNDLLENMLPKVEKSDITLQRQNKDIKRLLK